MKKLRKGRLVEVSAQIQRWRKFRKKKGALAGSVTKRYVKKPKMGNIFE